MKFAAKFRFRFRLLALVFLAISAQNLFAQNLFASNGTDQVCERLLKPQINRVAMVQYPIVGQLSYDQFINKVEGYIQQASENQANMIVFPEFNSADLIDTNASTVKIVQDFEIIAQKYTDLYFQKLSELSEKYNMVIVGGSIPRKDAQHIRNTCPIAFPNSELVQQDKIYLTPTEKQWGWQNGSSLNVVQSAIGKTAVLMCHDSEFPDISAKLAEHKPEILIVPSMTESIHGMNRVLWSAQARAVEHRAYVLVTGTVADNSNPRWLHFGRAVAITPSDSGFQEGVMVMGNLNSDEIVFVDLDMTKLRESRQDSRVWPARDLLQRQEPLDLETRIIEN